MMFDIVCVAPLIFIDHLSLRMPLNGAVHSQGEYSMSFKEKIPGCFGSADKIFSGHPCDTKRAKEMLIEALRETDSWSDFEGAIRNHLESICNTAYIDEQMGRVRDLRNYFNT
ncbi:hypothetical protein VU05_01525 [Desulfobulbus sp. F1]|nr:hypothetical protein [Desulfobulbus sp. F1]